MRLQNEDLLANVNVEERLTELHEIYKQEIEMLREKLESNSGETGMLIQCLERERDSLLKKIEIMEKELG